MSLWAYLLNIHNKVMVTIKLVAACFRKSVSRSDFGWKNHQTLNQSHFDVSLPLGEMKAPYRSCDEKTNNYFLIFICMRSLALAFVVFFVNHCVLKGIFEIILFLFFAFCFLILYSQNCY